MAEQRECAKDDSSSQQECTAVDDNPHWPYASAEDEQRDNAAGFSAPQVEGGVWTLSTDDIECLAVGTGLLGCGGGGDPNIGRRIALQQLALGRTIKVLNPLRVLASDVGLITTAAFMGAPSADDKVSGSEGQLALEALQRVLVSGVYTGEGGEEGKRGSEKVRVREKELSGGKKVWVAETDDLKKIDISNPADIELSKCITHLSPIEVGGINSFEPLALGAKCGLPVIDADGMGRAFPEVQMFTPFIYGSCKPYPSSVADNKGEVLVCTHVADAKELENFFREVCVSMGDLCAVSIGVLTLQNVLNTCILFSMSMAWQLGRAVKRAQVTHSSVLDAITSQQHGIVLIVGKVTGVEHTTEGGFDSLYAIVEGLDIYRGHKVKVLAKNENYLVRYMEGGTTDGAVMACTPDLISLVNPKTGHAITTDAVDNGQRVGVLALPANPRLLTPRAMQVVGPAAFGCPGDVQYQPPRTLQQIRKTVPSDQ